MDKPMFNELLSNVEDMDEMVKGKKAASREHHFTDPEVEAIREKTGLSQSQFAALIGVSKRTLENWEQERHHPVPTIY